MAMTTKEQARGQVIAQLKELHIKPQRLRGQNFLIDPSVLDHIVSSADLSAEDTVLEIGPGLGALTRLLTEKAGSLTVLEIEEAFVLSLQRAFAGQNHVDVKHMDALQFDYTCFAEGQPYRLFANVPYHITTPLLQKLLWEGGAWQDMTLMLQKEAALRIYRGKGRENGPLTLLASYFAACELLFFVPPVAFYPPPAVQSAVIRITRRGTPPVEGDIHAIMALAEAGFAERRKVLRNSLAASKMGGDKAYWQAGLSACGLAAECRAEELSLADFAALTAWHQEHQ